LGKIKIFHPQKHSISYGYAKNGNIKRSDQINNLLQEDHNKRERKKSNLKVALLKSLCLAIKIVWQ